MGGALIDVGVPLAENGSYRWALVKTLSAEIDTRGTGSTNPSGGV